MWFPDAGCVKSVEALTAAKDKDAIYFACFAMKKDMDVT